MTWQDVVALGLILGTVWVILAWHAWVCRCSANQHISDNAVKMSDNQLRIAQVPRSIFGSGLSPAVMHHSGGIGKMNVPPEKGVK